MAGYLLADSFGGLQSAENAQDTNRRMALASAMNSATQSLQSMRTANMTQAQREQEQENWENQFKFSSELAKQKEADEERRWNQQNEIGKGYLKIYQDQGSAA